MRKAHWEKNLFELIRRTASDLPMDVEAALRKVLKREKKGTHAWWALRSILENADVARRNNAPLCQDSGTLVFYCLVPVGFDTNALVARTRAAVSRATRAGFLRQNTIDSVSGAAYETNIAHGSPVFLFRQGARKTADVRLLMKGSGCENVGGQYVLPDPSIDAGRDLEGVRCCVLDSIRKAQGHGCPPAVVGVCVGGDRATGYAHAGEQFLRKIGDRSPVKKLARLEERLLRETRELGIGPMGLGGKAAAMGIKIDALSRSPESYFVSVSFMCWAFRRRGVLLGPEGGVHRWVY